MSQHTSSEVINFSVTDKFKLKKYNVKLIKAMQFKQMFVTAVCVLFLRID